MSALAAEGASCMHGSAVDIVDTAVERIEGSGAGAGAGAGIVGLHGAGKSPKKCLATRDHGAWPAPPNSRIGGRTAVDWEQHTDCMTVADGGGT